MSPRDAVAVVEAVRKAYVKPGTYEDGAMRMAVECMRAVVGLTDVFGHVVSGAFSKPPELCRGCAGSGTRRLSENSGYPCLDCDGTGFKVPR